MQISSQPPIAEAIDSVEKQVDVGAFFWGRIGRYRQSDCRQGRNVCCRALSP